jgi:hypothetical protein
MCFTLFKKRYYYYKVANYTEDKKYYIMCQNCFNLLPPNFQQYHSEPNKKSFYIRYDDTKILLETLIKNVNCNKCKQLNSDEFYTIINNALTIKPHS